MSPSTGSRWTFFFRLFARVPRPLAWKILVVLGVGATVVLGCLLGAVMLLWNVQRLNQNLLALSHSVESIIEVRRSMDNQINQYGDAVLVSRRAVLFDTVGERVRQALTKLDNDTELKKPEYHSLAQLLQEVQELYGRLNRVFLDVNYLLADGAPDTARVVWQQNISLTERTRLVSINLQTELINTRRGLEQQIQDNIGRTVVTVGVITATIVFILVGITLFVVTVMQRAMRQVRSGLNRLSQGDLSARIKTDHRDEIGDLVATLNRALGLVQQFITSSAAGREVQQAAQYLAHSIPKNAETASPIPALSGVFEQLTQTARYTAIFIYQGTTIRYVSPALQELTGYSLSELEGRDFWEIAHPDEQEGVKEHGLTVCHNVPTCASLEFRLNTRTGEELWAATSFTQVTLGGEPAELCALVDVTERKRQQEEILKAQRIESLGIVAGGIAHDFNNLLTAMVTNLSLARNNYSQSNPNLLQLLQEAENAALRASGLTRQLLTFTKEGTPVKGVVSLAELVRETAQFVLRGAQVNYRLELAPDLGTVEIDEGQISQVLNNLLINAVQAMPDGGYLTIKAVNLAETQLPPELPLAAGDYVLVSVQDTGTGIPPEIISRIFDPYFTTKQKGSGLGLAVSFSIAQQHGGYLAVESEVGRGTTFYLYLPATTKIPMTLPADPRPATSRKAKILVLEDLENIRYVIERTLKPLGYTVDSAEEGTRALELYNAARDTAPYDLLILDPGIPGGKGAFDVLREIRQQGDRVRAILATGRSDDELLARYKASSFDALLLKPFRMQELVAIVEETLSRPVNEG